MDEKQQIKQSLSKFIKNSVESSHIFGFKDGSEIKLNKAIYEIQHHLSNELNKYGINARLDVGIISASITHCGRAGRTRFGSPLLTEHKRCVSA
jgi:hypothetical protein